MNFLCVDCSLCEVSLSLLFLLLCSFFLPFPPFLFCLQRRRAEGRNRQNNFLVIMAVTALKKVELVRLTFFRKSRRRQFVQRSVVPSSRRIPHPFWELHPSLARSFFAPPFRPIFYPPFPASLSLYFSLVFRQFPVKYLPPPPSSSELHCLPGGEGRRGRWVGRGSYF